MSYPKFVEARVVMSQGGDYLLSPEGGIGGKPFPSESEAWAFGEAMKIANHFMFLPYGQQLKILRQFEFEFGMKK